MVLCRRVLVFGVVAITGGCSVELTPVGPAEIEVLHYDYSLDLESRAARSELRFRVEVEGDCVTLPMRTTGVTTVSFDDEPMDSGELLDEAMTACGRGWDVGTEVVLSASHQIPLETWDDSQVGYSVTTDSEEAPFHYLVSWVAGCDRFGPCDTAPDRFPRYSFHVTHPADVQVFCPGVITAAGTETHCEFSMDGGPTYSTFGVVASPSWIEHDLGNWSGAQVTLYDMPSTGIAAQIDPAQHADFVAWMTEQFGPYPYGDALRLIVGPTYWNGFEHPGNITLSDQLAAGGATFGNPLAHTVNHELAHQWAGDETTLAGTYDFVWKEAMAEYLTFVFEDERVSTSTASSTASTWKRSAGAAEFYPVPAERPPLLEYYGDVYGAGPMVLFRQVEAMTSRAAVLSALASLLGEQRAIGVEDVKLALETATGEDFDAYFDAWVYGEGAPTWPRYSVVVGDDPGDGNIAVTVRQDAPEAGLFGGAFTIRLRGESPEDIEDVFFNLGPVGAAETTVVARPSFEVRSHIFDVHRQTLAGESGAAAAPVLRINPWVARRPLR